MAATVRSSSLASFTNTGTEPTGAALNDALFAYVTQSGSTVATSGPAGWTNEFGAITMGAYHSVWSIKRGGSAPALGWTPGGGSLIGILIWAVQGEDTTTWTDAVPTGADNASSGSPASPSITTATDSALILVGLYTFGGTLSIPSGFTTDINSSANDMAGAHNTAGAHGATGAFTWTISPNNTSGTITIAVRPGAALGPGIPPTPGMNVMMQS